MLLETLDIGKNDIIIYSQNIFSAQNNFRIIFKEDAQRKAKRISFHDVCMFVDDTTPKNLIVYRLLTNTPDIGKERSRFGFSVIIDDNLEVIFFDPVYAVKEIESLIEKNPALDLRFRIQQVGLTSSIVINNRPSYSEVYSIDLTAKEANFQNDKVFVEALFSVTGGFKDTQEKANKSEGAVKIKNATGVGLSFTREMPKEEPPVSEKSKYKESPHKLTEDHDFNPEIISNISGKDAAVKEKSEQRKPSGSLGEFLNKSRKAEPANPSKPVSMLDIFKSSSSLNELLESKKDTKVVLKLTDK